MNTYAYEAVDGSGLDVNGVIEVATQSQALRRLKEMGFFPTKVREKQRRRDWQAIRQVRPTALIAKGASVKFRVRGAVRPRVLTVFTRQLATLLEAGMPLLRGLRLLQQQAEDRRLTSVIGKISRSIEEGDSFSEAIIAHPKVFNTLYVNLVRAGEASGALDLILQRLAGFQERLQRTKGKVMAAMVYPIAVLLVAVGVLFALMTFVVPRFQEVFEGLFDGRPLPAFTVFVFSLSNAIRTQAPVIILGAISGAIVLAVAVKTKTGRRLLDALKLRFPVVGDVFRKASVARFARTLGTLLRSGVPVLQALTIAKETAGNVLVARVVGEVREHVKHGDPMAPTLKVSKIFPVIVAGMVDVGEQTGALPEMLLRIADTYDDEVDHSVAAMTSLIEPIMIVFLAVIVGSIVIALFLPIIPQ